MKINEFYRHIDEFDTTRIKSFSIEAIVLFAEDEYGCEQLYSSFYHSFYLWEHRSIVHAMQHLSPEDKANLSKSHLSAINELQLRFGNKTKGKLQPNTMNKLIKQSKGHEPSAIIGNGRVIDFSDYIELMKR